MILHAFADKVVTKGHSIMLTFVCGYARVVRIVRFYLGFVSSMWVFNSY